MRAWEFLTEGEKPAVESDLEDLLVAAKATDLTDLDVEDLVAQLNDMGHSVTADSLVDMVDNLELELVDTVTLNTIQLKSHTVGDSSDDDDDDEGGSRFRDGDNEWEEEVSSEAIAKSSAMKNVRDRSERRRRTTKDAQI